MKWSITIVCVFSMPILLGAATPEARDLIESGNSFYRMGLYEEAGKQYLRAAEVDHDSPEISYNLGNVYHQKFLEAKLSAVPGVNNDRRSDWEQKAVAAYKQALASDAPSLRAKALFNLGNTYAEAERRVEAIAAYEEALRIIPNDEDTKHNLELLLKGKKIPPIVRIAEIPETVPPLTNIVMATGAGSLHTNVLGKAQSSGGAGAGKASSQSGGSGAGEGSQQATGGGGAWGTSAAAPAQQLGAGDADHAVLAQGDTSVKAEASASGDKGDKVDAKAGANESSGGKTTENTPGAGGLAGAAEGKAGTSSPDKASAKDKTAAAASDSTKPKDRDTSAKATSSDKLDPRELNVLDKASKAEQRYINQWTRPPDLKKPKDQDW